MTSRLTGVLIAMAALLATGLSTGGQIYYLLFYTLLLLTLLSLISVLWLLFSARIEMRGVKPRVERGEAMMTIFTVRHTSPLPVAALRIRLNVDVYKRQAWACGRGRPGGRRADRRLRG